jgi:Zn-dependent protease
MLGRITFNPLKHIDPFMTVIFPALLALAGAPPFGAAKPVPVNPRNYRHYVRGDIIVSLAGIGANLALFAVSAALFALVGVAADRVPALEASFTIAQRMLFYGMWLNVILAFFNLLPIPPLDGSHVFYHLLPPQAGLQFRRLQALGFLPILLVVWVFPDLLRTLLWPARQLMAAGVALVGEFAIGPGVWPS